MNLDQTREDIARLRVDFEREPRETALPLAQKLAWHSMELALTNQLDHSEHTWCEAMDVIGHVLVGPAPTHLERTEFIRIALGTARSLLIKGRVIESLAIVDEANEQFLLLASESADPTLVLALRGAILTVQASIHESRGDADVALSLYCEALLELMSGSQVNPHIVRSMIAEPLAAAGKLLG